MFVCFLEMERGAQSESTATKLTTQWKPLIIIIAHFVDEPEVSSCQVSP
jgi:hypothetical protein